MLSGVLEAIGLDASSFLYSLVAVLAGAYLKGYTGFGASMFWMTSLSLVLPPLQVVPSRAPPLPEFRCGVDRSAPAPRCGAQSIHSRQASRPCSPAGGSTCLLCA